MQNNLPPVGYPRLSTAQLPTRVLVPRWLKGKGVDLGAMRMVSPSFVQHPQRTDFKLLLLLQNSSLVFLAWLYDILSTSHSFLSNLTTTTRLTTQHWYYLYYTKVCVRSFACMYVHCRYIAISPPWFNVFLLPLFLFVLVPSFIYELLCDLEDCVYLASYSRN